MKRTGLLVFVLVLGMADNSHAQDARLWSGFSIRFNPSKRWKITLEEEARFFNNITRLDKLNTELTINYQVNKIIEGGILYRLISRKNPDRTFGFQHRFAAYLGVQKNIGEWTCFIKTSFQKTYPEYLRTDDWRIPENYVRPLLEISRELKNKKTEPYTNIEFWYRVPAGRLAFIDQYRYTAGVKHKLNKSHRLDLFYRFQQEIQVKEPLRAHILGIGYRFTIR